MVGSEVQQTKKNLFAKKNLSLNFTEKVLNCVAFNMKLSVYKERDVESGMLFRVWISKIASSTLFI